MRGHLSARTAVSGAAILCALALLTGLFSCTVSSPLTPGLEGSNVITLAGPDGGAGSIDGTGASARFYIPRSIATDGSNLYVADSYNHTIRKIEISTGTVTTLAGKAGASGSDDGTGAEARFNYPHGVATDGTNLYVADSYNHAIRKISISTGAVTTIAGTAGREGSDDGTGAAARFSYPYGITTSGSNLYVSDTGNHTIRKISVSTGMVTTIAGTAGVPGSENGTGAAALFCSPNGITTDDTDLYVADTGNHTIRRIRIGTGAVTTIGGKAVNWGSDDGTGTNARFCSPNGIATDGTNLYVADTYNHTIRRISISTGAVTTLAGTAGSEGSDDGTGAAARFYYPCGIASSGASLYVADSYNHTIRRVSNPSGTVSTLAGTAALFFFPHGIAAHGADLYVADTSNHTIRKISIPTGAVTTVAGTAGIWGTSDGTGMSSLFYSPRGIATDGTNLYVADTYNHTIRKVEISTGKVTTLAGKAGEPGSGDGVGTGARFNYPNGIATDGVNLYVADTGNHTIRKIGITTGYVRTLAGTEEVSGSRDDVGTSARFSYPHGIATDGTNLYVADSRNHTIRKIEISTGAVTTLAGKAGVPGISNGAGKSARFSSPNGITTDGTNLYVADTGNHTIRKISVSTGMVTTIAGTAGNWGSEDGTGAKALFYSPNGITSDGADLYVADTYNHKIRTIAK